MNPDTWTIGKAAVRKAMEYSLRETDARLEAIGPEIAGALVLQVLSLEMGNPADLPEVAQTPEKLKAEQASLLVKQQAFRQALAKLETLARPAQFPG